MRKKLTMTVFPLACQYVTSHTMNGGSPSEGTGNGCCTTLHRGEQSIEHTLTSEKRICRRLLLRYRSRRSDRPKLHHGVLRLLALEFRFQDNVLQSVPKAVQRAQTPTSTVYEPFSAMLVIVPIALGGSMILWLSTSEFS